MVSTDLSISNLEDLIGADMAQQLADSLDGEFLVELKYFDHKKLDGPESWYFTRKEIKHWCEETLPDCFYHSNTLYYMDDEDATMFRLKWL